VVQQGTAWCLATDWKTALRPEGTSFGGLAGYGVTKVGFGLLQVIFRRSGKWCLGLRIPHRPSRVRHVRLPFLGNHSPVSHCSTNLHSLSWASSVGLRPARPLLYHPLLYRAARVGSSCLFQTLSDYATCQLHIQMLCHHQRHHTL
jgi:hypothetical protein